jgi:hypothetical protein
MTSNDIYNVKKYTDEELYNIMNLINPTDEDLEKTIIEHIEKYSNVPPSKATIQLENFFKDIYNYFFYEEVVVEEGMTTNSGGLPDISNNPMDNTTKYLYDNGQVGTNKDMSTNKGQASRIGPSGNSEIITQSFNYLGGIINPILKETIKRIININSFNRDKTTYPLSTNFTFNLSETLSNVVSLQLYSYSIPYSWYNVSKEFGANFFYINGIAPGINSGNNNYKVSILPGNYSTTSTDNNLFTALNQSIQTQLVLGRPDVSFNNTNISYNSTTCNSTFNINIQNLYNETFYVLDFSYNINYTDTDDNYRILYIPTYLGYQSQTWNTSYVYSSAFSSTPSSTELFTIYKGINDYFTVYPYVGPNSYQTISGYNVNLLDSSSNDIYYSINLFPLNLSSSVQYSRDEIIAEINKQLSTFSIFDSSNSSIQYIASKQKYQLKLKPLRNASVYTMPNIKWYIVFPDPQPPISGTTPVWVSTGSCFQFDTSFNELNEINSDTYILNSNYPTPQLSIYLTCINPEYQGTVNDYDIIIPSSQSMGYPYGYTRTEFIDTVTIDISNCPNSFELLPNTMLYYDTNNYLNAQFYIEKQFTRADYYITMGSFLTTSTSNHGCNMKINGQQTGEISLDNSYNGIGQLQRNVAYQFNSSSSNIFLTLTPTETSPNSGAAPYIIYNPPYPTGQDYFTITQLSQAINNAFRTYVTNNGCYPLKNMSFVYTSYNIQLYNVTLNINVDMILSQNDYSVTFIDSTTTTWTNNTWYTTFSIPEPSYNLIDLSNQGYLIQSTDVLNQNIITLYNGELSQFPQNNQFAINPFYDVLSGVYIAPTMSDSGTENNIIFELPASKTGIRYTTMELIYAINTAFGNDPRTIGSVLTTYSVNNKLYAKIRPNVNQIFTTSSYSLVFYNPSAFMTCTYSPNSSVQNVTWNSTIGFILGYTYYTEYVLDSSYVTVNADSSNLYYSTYYGASTSSAYTYQDVSSAFYELNGLNNTLNTLYQLTNSIISLTGDTAVNLNLISNFTFILDDYMMNHLNDGVVQMIQGQLETANSSYENFSLKICNPVSGVSTNINNGNETSSGQNMVNGLTQNQIYSINQRISAQQPAPNYYSPPTFPDEVFAIMPIKPVSPNEMITEYGGSVQNQNRYYFGPVNIRRMTIKLLTDYGNIFDLNNREWSIQFICEQLYRRNSA